MLDKKVLDETYRIWKARNINGASMSMLCYDEIDNNLVKLFNKVMMDSLGSNELRSLYDEKHKGGTK